jgi:tetratricopeptide (TPR) repeat protein
VTTAGKSSVHELHIGVAEAGKLAALKGDHGEALRHYREAIRMAVSAKAPEVFFRHYTQCTLESLELTGDYAEIIEFCEKADAHYRAIGAATPFQRRDRGSILERLGIVRLKSGDVEAARSTLAAALDVAGPDTLPIAKTVQGWLRRGLSPDLRRLTDLQKRHSYFSVRDGQVDASRARALAPQGNSQGEPRASAPGKGRRAKRMPMGVA